MAARLREPHPCPLGHCALRVFFRLEFLMILRIPQTCKATGQSRSALYVDMARGVMVQPFKIGARASGVLEQEVAEIVKARAAGWSDEQLKALVTRLHAKRKVNAPEIAA